MLIFLIGMMGCGKTTVGSELAERLHLPFFDTDHIIESIEGKKIATIFNKKGEAYFRELEKEIIDFWKIKDGVVATGGGIGANLDLINRMNSLGKTIYLECNIETLLARIPINNKRPLLSTDNPKTIADTLLQMMKTRKKNYVLANFTVNGNANIGEVLSEILSKVQ